jgi:hypothetical protein
MHRPVIFAAFLVFALATFAAAQQSSPGAGSQNSPGEAKLPPERPTTPQSQPTAPGGVEERGITQSPRSSETDDSAYAQDPAGAPGGSGTVPWGWLILGIAAIALIAMLVSSRSRETTVSRVERIEHHDDHIHKNDLDRAA